jgi:hypothetical protein
MASERVPVLRRGWSRIADGERPWGSLDVGRDRYGTSRYRLIVYPPGLSQSERRWLRLWRGWPLWGAGLWLLCEILLVPLADPWTALATSTAITLAAGATAFWHAGAARSRVHTLGVTVISGYRDPSSEEHCRTIAHLIDVMADADDRYAEGQLSPAAYEMAWWSVYDQSIDRTAC